VHRFSTEWNSLSFFTTGAASLRTGNCGNATARHTLHATDRINCSSRSTLPSLSRIPWNHVYRLSVVTTLSIRIYCDFNRLIDLLYYHPRSGVIMRSVAAICLSVCLGLALTFKRLDLQSLFLVSKYIYVIKEARGAFD